MSIFGDETITVTESPDEGQEEVMAEETENEESFDDQDDSDNADLDEEGDEQDNEQTDDDEDESSPEDGQGDGLILGKFKTQDDLAKAYQNLQREFTKARQSGNQTEVVQQTSSQDQQPDLNTAFWERFRDNPLQTMEAIIGHIVEHRTAPIFEERRTASLSTNIQAVAKEYRQVGTEEGLKTLIGKVEEIALELGKPDLINNPSPRILQMAAREAFGDTKAQAFKKGQEAARADAERARQSKQGNGAKGGARQQQQQTDKTPEQEIADNILAAGRDGGLFG